MAASEVADVANLALKILEICAILGTGGVVLVKGGGMMERFKQQETKLTALSVKFDHLASETARIERMDERMMAQGQRLDDLIVRFNRYVNGAHLDE